MKLETYITETRDITIREAARELSELARARNMRPISHQRVSNWASGKAKPQRDDEIKLVFDWSGHNVTANDFFNLPSGSQAGGILDHGGVTDRRSQSPRVAGGADDPALAGQLDLGLAGASS